MPIYSALFVKGLLEMAYAILEMGRFGFPTVKQQLFSNCPAQNMPHQSTPLLLIGRQ